MYLGVDGGGTKTAFVLINNEGVVKAKKVLGTSHYIQVGFDGFKNIIEKGIESICDKADVDKKDINYSFFAVPAYGEIKNDILEIERIIAEVIKSNNFYCANDVEAGWAGSLACKPGINIVAGTGSIGFAKDHFNNSARSGGWGYFCGDEGSAYDLGKKLISLFTKEADGRLKKTPLYYIIKEKLNLNDDFEIIDLIYNKYNFKRDKVASMAVYLDEAAQKGDKYAVKTFKNAAAEYYLIIKSLRKKLNFKKDEKIKISYSGGVFNAGRFILDPLRNKLDNSIYELQKPILEPVLGAAFYALLIKEGYKDYEKQLSKLKEYNIK